VRSPQAHPVYGTKEVFLNYEKYKKPRRKVKLYSGMMDFFFFLFEEERKANTGREEMMTSINRNEPAVQFYYKEVMADMTLDDLLTFGEMTPEETRKVGICVVALMQLASEIEIELNQMNMAKNRHWRQAKALIVEIRAETNAALKGLVIGRG